MLNLPLDPTDDQAQPAFRDAVSCAKWLAQLQLTDLHQAHSVVRSQLDTFNRYPMPGLERLRTLELLRETVAHLQADYARKLTARKLPLSEAEFTILVCITALWQLMVNGYQRCLQTLLAGDKLLVPYSALLCQRCLLYTGTQIFECLRNGYEFEGRLWQQLHTIYAFAESKGLQSEEISLIKELHSLYGMSKKEASRLNDLADRLNSNTVNCNTLYVRVLLTSLAYPGELTRNQSQLLDRWLLRWSATLPLEHRYAASKGDALPLAVDLAGAQGLQPMSCLPTNESGSSVRYLAMMPLSKLLRVKTILLQQGQSPQQLDLGESGSSADCAELLKFLHQRWCEGGLEQQSDPGQSPQQTRMCYGLEDIYAWVADKPFQASTRDVVSDSLARKQIATFGRVLSEDNRSPAITSVEMWRIKEESLLGARLLREGNDGVRLGLNQIVATRRVGTEFLMLGTTLWIQVTLSGALAAGIRYLPGVPQAITLKSTALNSKALERSAAVLLTAVTTLNIPSSLIVPRDWFVRNRVLEVTTSDNRKHKVKLDLSLESGLDFERVSFTVV